MKMLKVAVFAMLMLSLTPHFAYAQVPAKPAPGTSIVQTNERTWVYLTPVCKMGLQFILVTQDKRDTGGASAGVQVVQVMAPIDNGNRQTPTPKTCVEDVKPANAKDQNGVRQ